MNRTYFNRYFRPVLALGLLGMVVVSSCSEEKYLNLTPPTDLVSSEAFSTPQRIESLVTGIYARLKTNNYYGGRYILYLDARGEEFINTTNNSFTAYDAWANTYHSGHADIINLWSASYAAINSANLVIEGINANVSVVGETAAAAYIAEAKFVRAFAYFGLITSFGRPYVENGGTSRSIPLRLQAERGMENNDFAPSTVAEVYEQILLDLNDAEADLPETQSVPSRAHRNTAIALKTRVYLTQENWAAVMEEAAKIAPQRTAPFAATSGVGHQLQELPAVLDQASMISTFMSLSSSDAIFSMPFSELDMLSGQSSPGYIYNGNAEYYLNPDAILGESQWAQTDARRLFLRQNTNNNRFYLAKFGFNAPYLNPLHMIRYAEVLLNYAEAAVESGDLELAGNLLQAVHERSDPAYEFPAGTLSSAESLLDAILIERRIELLGEGLRANDIVRRLLTFPAKPGPTPARAVNPSDESYIWPISNNELVNNGLMD